MKHPTQKWEDYQRVILWQYVLSVFVFVFFCGGGCVYHLSLGVSFLHSLKRPSKGGHRIRLFSLLRPDTAIRFVVFDQTVEAQKGGQGINDWLRPKGEFSEIRYSTISKKKITTTTTTVPPVDFCSGGLTEQEIGFEWQRLHRLNVGFQQVRRTEVDTRWLLGLHVTTACIQTQGGAFFFLLFSN